MTPAERQVADDLQAQGYTVLKSGCPDFFAFKDGSFKFVEVKHGCDTVKPNQLKYHEALKHYGIQVEIIHLEKPDREKIHHDDPLRDARLRFRYLDLWLERTANKIGRKQFEDWWDEYPETMAERDQLSFILDPPEGYEEQAVEELQKWRAAGPHDASTPFSVLRVSYKRLRNCWRLIPRGDSAALALIRKERLRSGYF
jgi:hypothetical protein